MLLKVSDKDLLLDYVSALGLIKSAGYHLELNKLGTKSAVMAADGSMNLVAETLSFRIESELQELILRIADMKLFKKFIKLVDVDNPQIEFDPNLNTLKHGEHVLSLNAKEFSVGTFRSKMKFEDNPHYLVRIPDNNALCLVLSNTKMGEMLEIRSNRLVMGSWDMAVDITDKDGVRPSPDMCVRTYRTTMRDISKVHKKIGDGDLFIRIFKEKLLPVMLCYGSVPNYRAYCAISNGEILKPVKS
jgi:hypothetical protein